MLAKKRKTAKMKKIKSARQMERHLKGMANHYRIEILLAVAENAGITLDGIARMLKANSRTIGEHTRRLHQAGLINKKRNANSMKHELSPYGKLFVRFLKSFQET
jgi:DNA-binding MarR family transcriptional regulator